MHDEEASNITPKGRCALALLLEIIGPLNLMKGIGLISTKVFSPKIKKMSGRNISKSLFSVSLPLPRTRVKALIERDLDFERRRASEQHRHDLWQR